MFKTYVNGSDSPLKFECKVSEAYEKSDWSIYLSLNKYQEPSWRNSDRKCSKKFKNTVFYYKAPNYAKKFKEDDILYFSVFSESGSSFKIQISKPPEDEKKKTRRPKTQKTLEIEEMFDPD